MTLLTDEMRAFLSESRFAVLATVDPDGTPRQTVMWYELQGDRILFNTKRGRRKDRNLARDPRASLCIEDGYRFIAIEGHVEEIRDPVAAQTDIRRIATRYGNAEDAERQWRRVWSKEERISYVMRIEKVRSYGFDEG